MARDKKQAARYQLGFYDTRKGDSENDFARYQMRRNGQLDKHKQITIYEDEPKKIESVSQPLPQPSQAQPKKALEKEVLESPVSAQKEISSDALDRLLAGTQVETPVNDEISYSLFYFSTEKNSPKLALLDYYLNDVYPAELKERHQCKNITKEKALFVSPNDLNRLVCEDQIAHVNENKHHICVNLSAVPQEKIGEYYDTMLGFLSEEIVLDKRVKIIIDNKQDALNLSVPELQMDFI